MTLLDDKVIAIIVLFVSLAVLFIPREGGEVSGGRRGETDMPLLVSLKRGEQTYDFEFLGRRPNGHSMFMATNLMNTRFFVDKDNATKITAIDPSAGPMLEIGGSMGGIHTAWSSYKIAGFRKIMNWREEELRVKFDDLDVSDLEHDFVDTFAEWL